MTCLKAHVTSKLSSMLIIGDRRTSERKVKNLHCRIRELNSVLWFHGQERFSLGCPLLSLSYCNNWLSMLLKTKVIWEMTVLLAISILTNYYFNYNIYSIYRKWQIFDTKCFFLILLSISILHKITIQHVLSTLLKMKVAWQILLMSCILLSILIWIKYDTKWTVWV